MFHEFHYLKKSNGSICFRELCKDFVEEKVPTPEDEVVCFEAELEGLLSVGKGIGSLEVELEGILFVGKGIGSFEVELEVGKVIGSFKVEFEGLLFVGKGTSGSWLNILLG